MDRRQLLKVAGGALLAPAVARGDTYPGRPILLQVPFPPGGAADVMARLVARKMSEALGQPVAVENKPGAGGIIGAAAVARAAPDGYTLLLSTTSTHSLAAAIKSSLPYDPEKSFAPIIEIANGKSVLLVSSASGIQDVASLVRLMKSRGADNNFGSAGVGTLAHLNGEAFKRAAGVEMTHIPYKGMSLAVQDLIGGQLTMMFDSAVSALAVLKGGRVRALAVAGRKRTPVLPDVPTLIEAGVPGFDMEAYFGLWAPAGTPAPVVERLNGVLNAAIASPDLRSEITSLAADPAGGTSAAFAERIARDRRKWKQIIADAGITPE
ncbi:tripartite tricarboxylate transporter substrate binding protein [Pigmentiphaga sp. YJ18]|uniref:Bug family tripartite tricarboxylate transporter substrate binding protein n=1 Tax=Pigmentiphaga sp. YJ18 TaxID=3134907 RepID=UPI003111AD01